MMFMTMRHRKTFWWRMFVERPLRGCGVVEKLAHAILALHFPDVAGRQAQCLAQLDQAALPQD